MDIKDKVILITGASSGIGYNLALQLAKEKCSLALLARRKDVLDNLAGSLRKSGCKASAFECDVTDLSSVNKAFSQVKKEFGRIDIAVLNAGVSGRSSVKKFDAGSAAETINVNVNGIINCFNEILPYFLNERKGMIVGISSLADGRGFPKSGVYCASKAAASIFLESMRAELKAFGIKVITVKPGFVKTPMTDKNDFKMPFLMSPEKAVKIIISGIKKEKRIIQFPLFTVLGSKLLKYMPDALFEKIAAKV